MLELERLTKLIDEILVLSELKQVELPMGNVMDIRKEIKSAVKLMQSNANSKKINMKVLLPTDEVLVLSKIDRIDQMMINLIDNAIKYTNERGQITVKLERKDNSAVITIEDNGIGIPADDIPRLFDRFYRVDKSRGRALGGTGLGLSIVAHIVDLLNGTIKVNSELGKGTMFIIRLPLAQKR